MTVIAKRDTLKDTSTSVAGVLFKDRIESNLFLFIAILSLQILGNNAVGVTYTEFESSGLIQLFV